MRKMITFDDAENRFNYRVVGIAVNSDSVLLHQADGESFWTFPGGRAELGEPAETTLRREMKEELNTEVDIIRPLWFVENFFVHLGKRYHEIALYFLMKFRPDCVLTEIPSFYGDENGIRLNFRWFSKDPETLSSLPLQPCFLQTSLEELPETVQHIVYDQTR